MTELSDYKRLVSDPADRRLRLRIAELRWELSQVLAWAETERAPLRDIEIESIRHVLRNRPLPTSADHQSGEAVPALSAPDEPHNQTEGRDNG